MNLPFPIFHTVCVYGSRKTRTHFKHSLYLILVAVHLIVLNKMCSCFWLRSFSLLLAPCDQFYIHLCHRKLHIIFFLVYTYFHLVLYISLSFSIPMSFHVRLLSVRTHTHTHTIPPLSFSLDLENCCKPAFVQIKPAISFGLPATLGEPNRTRYVNRNMPLLIPLQFYHKEQILTVSSFCENIILCTSNDCDFAFRLYPQF